MGENSKQQTAPAADLCGDEAALYRAHHDRLIRSVSRVVSAPAALIEDACQTTLAILLRRQPDRGERLFGWLRTVAIHEAYRLSRQQRREERLEELRCEDGDWDAILATRFRLGDAIEARRALQALASLPDRQRSDLTMSIAGYSYREIMQTDARTYTNVNKHLAKARARIRRIEREGA